MASNINHSRLQAWIDHVFDHPVVDDPKHKEWYWADEAPEWDGAPEEVLTLIAEAFERSGELLQTFSDAQLAQGFWYLLDGGRSPFLASALVDSRIPLDERLRALRSFESVFEQIMKPRCANQMVDDPSSSELNVACYMWWDILRFSPLETRLREPDQAPVAAAPD